MNAVHEARRSEALAELDIAGLEPDAALDRLARLTRSILGMPIAVVTLVDGTRQWIASHVGLQRPPATHDLALFRPESPDDPVQVIKDARADERFRRDPLVTGPDGIRFVAGAPLISRDGLRLGNLFVLDRTPRMLGHEAQDRLRELAAVVVDELELRFARGVAAGEIERCRLAERQLHLVNLLLEETASATDHADAVRHFLRGIGDHYGADCGLIYLIADGDAPVLPTATYGGEDPANAAFLAAAASTPMRPGNSLSWTALDSGEPTTTVDLGAAPAARYPLAHRAREAGFESALVVPLRDHVNYVLSLLFRGPPANLDQVGTDAARLSAKLVPLLTQRRVAEELRREQALAALLLDNIDVPIVGFDHDQRYTLWNAAMAARTGLSLADVAGRTAMDVFAGISPSVHMMDPVKAEVLAGNVRIVQDVPYLDVDGTPSFYDGTYIPLRDPAARVLGGIGILNDATARREADAARAERHRLEGSIRFQQMSAASPSAIICLEGGRISYWNEAATALSGYHASDVMERAIALLVSEPDQESFAGWLEAASGGTGGEPPRRWQLRRKDGTLCPVDATVSSWREGGRLLMGLTINDVSRQEQDERRLERLARTDFLTGLANRTSINARLLQAARDGQCLTAVLFDLDGFKHINDSLGHDAGDTVLREVATRLRDALGHDQGTLGRQGGDEFIILMPVTSVPPAEAMALARALQRTLRRPFVLGARSFVLSATVGIAVGIAGDEPHALLTHADLALYDAKARQRGSIGVFEPELKRLYEARRQLEHDIQRAIDRDELVLHYQPQVELATGAIIGAEALIRWNHPARGLLAPFDFLHALEGSTARAVGNRVLDRACAEAAAWQHAGRDLAVAVNLFAEQLTASDLPGIVAAALDRHGLPPHRLELELTETLAIRNEDALLVTLNELRRMGVNLAFDDFGTGYASLSTLKRFPINRLKIDKGFVRDLDVDDSDAAIVDAMLALSRHLGLRVIAEGIETPSQAAFLLARGCWGGQGHLYGRPAVAI